MGAAAAWPEVEAAAGVAPTTEVEVSDDDGGGGGGCDDVVTALTRPPPLPPFLFIALSEVTTVVPNITGGEALAASIVALATGSLLAVASAPLPLPLR